MDKYAGMFTGRFTLLIFGIIASLAPYPLTNGNEPEALPLDVRLTQSAQRHAQVVHLYETGRFLDALEIARENLDVREKLFGVDHSDTADSQHVLGTLLSELARYEDAEPYLVKALSARQKIKGTNHPETAHTLLELAIVKRSTGDLEQSDQFIRQSLQIFTTQLGADHPDTARVQEYLGYFLTEEGDFDEARLLLTKSLEIRENIFSKTHIATARSHLALGQLLLVTRDLTGAEEHFRIAVDTLVQVAGEEHPVTARARNHLGILFFNIGDLIEARNQFQKALSTREKILGPDHSYTAESLNNLASMFHRMADYAKAKPLFERALETVIESRGEHHPYSGIMLHNLARLRSEMGDLTGARTDFERALSILDESLGKQQNTAIAHVSLANVLRELGEYENASSHLEEALNIQKSVFSEGHLQTATTLENFAQLFQLQQDYAEAKIYHEEAKRIRTDLLGANHYITANSVHSLGALHLINKEFNEAREYFEQARSIRESILGVNHPDTIATIIGLASVQQLKNNTQSAIALMTAALNAEESLIEATTFIGSRRQKQLFLEKFVRSTHAAVSLQLESQDDFPDTTSLAMETVLRRKGRLLDINSEPLKLIRGQLTPTRQSKLDELSVLNERQAYLSLYMPANVDIEARRRLMTLLENEIESKEDSLSRDSAAFQQARKSAALVDIQANIPDDGALIEFFVHDPISSDALTTKDHAPESRYIAYVLTSTGKPRSVSLDNVADVNDLVLLFRQSISNKSDEAFDQAHKLYKLIFKKIRPLLSDKSTLIVSPDGALNLVPFTALLDEKGRYLVEDYVISYVSSGRDLLRWNENTQARERPILFGDISFDSEPGPPSTARGAKAPGNFSSLYFSPLPGTAREVQEIGRILGLSGGRFRRFFESIRANWVTDAISPDFDKRILTREHATEARVKSVRGPSILHLATHGFFFPLSTGNKNTGDGNESNDQPDFLENPLLRSGLALAGFNKRRTAASANDGVLTALEFMGLDLYGTEIVALSACNSGVGDVRAGEGVFGLRRALELAGANTQVLTLWHVADGPTQELMVSWYRQLKEGKGRAVAMQVAQTEALRSTETPNSSKRLIVPAESEVANKVRTEVHPYYWAGFIVSGRPGPVDTMILQGY